MTSTYIAPHKIDRAAFLNITTEIPFESQESTAALLLCFYRNNRDISEPGEIFWFLCEESTGDFRTPTRDHGCNRGLIRMGRVLVHQVAIDVVLDHEARRVKPRF